MKKRLVVIDISSFIFRAFFAIRVLHSPDGTPINAVHGILNMMLKLFSVYQPTHVLFAKDTKGGTFRNELYEEYKANRSEPPEDLIPQFALISQLIDHMGGLHSSHENYEADDIIGSACIQWADKFDEILIASGDKDLMQFVNDKVRMVDTMKDKIYDEPAVFEKMGVRPDQIVDYLSMVGDTSDNIPGMRGIGAKGAAKLLAEHDTLEKCIEVKDTFTGKKLTTAFTEYLDDAILSKSLVQIVTDIDLQIEPEATQFSFYPTDGLIDFLKGLGFKSALKKLNDIRYQVAQAEGNSGQELVDLSQDQKVEFETKLVTTEEEFKAAIEAIESSSGLSLHTEYDSSDHINREIVSISISVDGESSYYFPFAHEEGSLDRNYLEILLEKTWGNENLELSSEHVKRDVTHALRIGLDFKAQHFDITQAHYVISASSKHDLVSMAMEYLDRQIEVLPKKEAYLQMHSLENASRYSVERSSVTYQLTEYFKKELKEHDVEKVYYNIDDPLIPVLCRMERNGIILNKGYLSEFEVELSKKLADIGKKVSKYSENDVNLGSPKQVGEFLFTELALPVIKKTQSGDGNSTDAEVLVELDSRDLHVVPGLLLQHREISKILSTYVKALPQMVHSDSGRIHSTFNQHTAVTGRLASLNPNLQNIPIRTELGRRVRKAFIAKPGHVLISADYSQVELRLLAHFSEDPTMLKAFKNNVDVHSQTASEVLGIALENVTSEDRSKAKAVNFGLMYGQSSFGLAKALRISRKEAKEYITNYFEGFNKVKSYLDSLKERAEETGYALTLFGRKRFLPDIKSQNRNIKSAAERLAVNSPVQGTAADIIKFAMINIDAELSSRKLKSKMLLQVHDELVFEVPEDEVAIMNKLVRKGMEEVVDLKVPLTVDMGMGVNWFDLK